MLLQKRRLLERRKKKRFRTFLNKKIKKTPVYKEEPAEIALQ
jgi:hypothetical protein